MHNKLAGTKEFGRTIRIHNTPLPPSDHSYTHTHTHTHTLYLSHPFTRAHSPHTNEQTYTHKANKKKKNNSNMDSLINTTCFHKSD